jgi:hypothetical protein
MHWLLGSSLFPLIQSSLSSILQARGGPAAHAILLDCHICNGVGLQNMQSFGSFSTGRLDLTTGQRRVRAPNQHFAAGMKFVDDDPDASEEGPAAERALRRMKIKVEAWQANRNRVCHCFVRSCLLVFLRC